MKIAAYFDRLKSKVSLTLDGWTSPNRHSTLGITCHWIDESWTMTDIVLDALEVLVIY